MANEVRTLLVDDEPAIRTLVRCVLGALPGIEVVGEASDGLEAVEFCNRDCPELLITDIEMPRMSGLEAAEQVRRSSPQLGVVIFSGSEIPERVHRMLADGATVYVPKRTDSRELLDAVQAVATAIRVAAASRPLEAAA